MNPREIEQIGPYPVVEFLAEGGMAWVFKVEDPKFHVHRALKMLKPQAAQGDEFRRFESEAKLLARIDHPNLVTIFDLIAAAQPDHAAPLWCDCAWTYRDPQGRYR